MRIVKSFALFCDDVREEASGQSTFVGVYGPEVSADKFPHRIRQLCIVVDVRVQVQATVEELFLRFSFPNDKDAVEAVIPLEEALDEPSAQKPAGTIAATGSHVFQGVPIERPGKIVVAGKIGQEAEFEEIGFLEIVRSEEAAG